MGSFFIFPHIIYITSELLKFLTLTAVSILTLKTILE